MNKLVTIGLPLYKRVEYIPSVLHILSSQDYPNIDLLVSDNGLNGDKFRILVDQYYKKPYRFRQNTKTVGISAHFNQLLAEAKGDYVGILADDDEISFNYVSDLVDLLERNPKATVAFSVQESIDNDGNLLARSDPSVPELLSGPEFIKAAWGTKQYGFRSFSTFVARTKNLQDVGGFPLFWVAQGDEDALIVKATLDNFVAFSPRSVFRKRFHGDSDQYSMDIEDLAHGLKDLLNLIYTDPHIRAYASKHPAEWAESKRYLVENVWKTYYYRWQEVYKERMPASEWVLAAFKMPFLPGYYSHVGRALFSEILGRVKRLFPGAYGAAQSARNGLRKVR